MVVSVNRAARTFTASIEEIPDFMRAMTMPFEVLRPGDLDNLAPGAIVEFTLVVDKQSSHAERIRSFAFESVEQDPFSASRLTLLNEIVAGGSAVKSLAIGETVPDFRLTDQKKRSVSLSSLRGRSSRSTSSTRAARCRTSACASPTTSTSCRSAFKQRLGRDLVLLTVTFDPVHDTPEVLAKYADAVARRRLPGIS